MAYQDWKNVDTSGARISKKQFVGGCLIGFLFLVLMGFIATWGG